MSDIAHTTVESQLTDKDKIEKIRKLRAYLSTDEWSSILKWCDEEIEKNKEQILNSVEVPKETKLIYSNHQRMKWRADILETVLAKITEETGEPLKDELQEQLDAAKDGFITAVHDQFGDSNDTPKFSGTDYYRWSILFLTSIKDSLDHVLDKEDDDEVEPSEDVYDSDESSSI